MGDDGREANAVWGIESRESINFHLAPEVWLQMDLEKGMDRDWPALTIDKD